MKLPQILIITRAWSFTITLVSVTTGTILAYQDGPVSIPLYLAALLAAISFHAGANVLNDYFDLRQHIDTPQAPTALYRPHPVFALLLEKTLSLG